MPPKFKFTREQITAAALCIVSENGAEALSARALAERLGSSTKTIFGLFSGMDEVCKNVIAAANELYTNSYFLVSLTSKELPPYKASGMAYIRFAKEQPNLFKLLYMRDRTNERISENREEIRPVINILMEKLGIDEDTAFIFHLEMWLYVHGIATMIATGYIDWEMDFVSQALTDMYLGLSQNFAKENKSNEFDQNS